MRRVAPLLDCQRDELFALHARIFGKGKAERFRARFDQLFVHNPYRREGEVTNWVMTSDAGVVGHLGALPIAIKVGSERLYARWIVDLMVDPPHRFGPELAALHGIASGSADVLIGYGMPEHVARNYVKQGWKRLAVAPFLVKCLNLRGVAGLLGPRGRTRAGRLRFLLRGVANLPRFARQLVHSGALRRTAEPPRGGSGEVALHDTFDQTFDRLWERVGAAYPVAVERNCRYLTWRYRLGGDDGARLIVLRGADGLEGFAVIEKVRWRGIVVGLVSELVTAPERDVEALRLLGFAEDLLRREGVSAMLTEGFPARVRAAFRKRAFIEPTPEAEPAVFCARLQRCPALLLENVDNWLLTPGDCDRSMGYPRVPWQRA